MTHGKKKVVGAAVPPQTTTTKSTFREKNRDKMTIAVDMLNVTMEQGGASRTRVMYTASLSFTQLQHYLPLLIKAGLLTKLPDGRYSTTDKGREFIESFKTTKGYLRTIEL